MVGEDILTDSFQRRHRDLQSLRGQNEDHKRDKSLQLDKVVSKDKGSASTTFYYRIPVVEACLGCHGSQNSMPDFIIKKYPSDKAFGFKAGDLRGLY